MSKYIHNIIKYFFSHDMTEELTGRVHQRLASSFDDNDSTYREIWDGLSGEGVSDETIEEAWKRTQNVVFGKDRHIKKWYRWSRSAALWAIPVALLVTSFFLYKAITNKTNDYKEVCFVHKFTAYGERELITLPDSTKVWLNSGSTLIYPSSFVSKERNVCLSGEAFFDVSKDAEHPFIVDANQIRLKVLGTTFNVCSYPDSPMFTATLETGKIQIDVEGKKEPYVLSTNDRLEYNYQTGEVNISQVQAHNYSSWRTGSLYLDDISFPKVINLLERTYNIKIHVRHTRFNNQTIRAHFSANESIDEVMAIIQMLIPDLHYEHKGNDLYIE